MQNLTARWVVWPLLLIAVLAISSSAILVRYTDVSALTLSWWRTLGGGLLLLPAARRSQSANPAEDPQPTGRAVGPWLALAGLALGIHFWSWLASLDRTSVAASVALVSTAPFFVVGLSWRRERGLGVTGWLALVITVVGAAVIAFAGPPGDVPDGGRISGPALALVGAAAMAVYLVVGDRVRRQDRLSTAAYAGPVYLAAAGALTVALAATGTDPFDLGRRDLLVIVAMIAGPQLCGHTVLNYLLQRMGAITIALVLLAEPVGATALARLVLGERAGTATLLGAALVVIGLAVRLAVSVPADAANDARPTEAQSTSR